VAFRYPGATARRCTSEPAHRARREAGAGRGQRRRQVHPDQAALAPLRSDQGPSSTEGSTCGTSIPAICATASGLFQDYVKYQFTALENVGLARCGPSRPPRIDAAVDRAGARTSSTSCRRSSTPCWAWFEKATSCPAPWQKIALAPPSCAIGPSCWSWTSHRVARTRGRARPVPATQGAGRGPQARSSSRTASPRCGPRTASRCYRRPHRRAGQPRGAARRGRPVRALFRLQASGYLS